MATTKRMFSNDIVGSDAFFEMPSTSQALYFHLGMRCDDDGFVNPNVTMRMTGANKNDLDVLILKRFLLPFKNGVVVIKHHRINNNWDARDSRRTLYTEELKQLFVKENRSYTLEEGKGEPVLKAYPKLLKVQSPDGNPTGIRRQNRIEKNRIEKNTDIMSSKEDAFNQFWNAYPKKELKKKSQEIWKRKKLDSSLGVILEFITVAQKTDRWKKGFIKQPPAFLNGECWNDDVSTYNDRVGSQGKSVAIIQ